MPTVASPAVSSPAAEPVLLAEGLRFGWTRRGPPLLDLAPLRLMPRERVFLSGASGSGKSTLLNLLAGTLAPQAGRVVLSGADLYQAPARQRDRIRSDHLGFIFQQFNLLPFLSVRDNVLLPCRFSPQRRQRAIARDGTLVDAAHRLLAALGLGDPALATRQAGLLSVGQQQRVAAARALVGDPALVIADEPTSALDADARDEFLGLLFDECTRNGSALLMVSHDRQLAARFDRSLSLTDLNQAGRTPAAGTP